MALGTETLRAAATVLAAADRVRAAAEAHQSPAPPDLADSEPNLLEPSPTSRPDGRRLPEPPGLEPAGRDQPELWEPPEEPVQEVPVSAPVPKEYSLAESRAQAPSGTATDRRHGPRGAFAVPPLLWVSRRRRRR